MSPNKNMNHETLEEMTLSDHDMTILIYKDVKQIKKDLSEVRADVKKNSNFRIQAYFLVAIAIALSPYIIFVLSQLFA